MIIYLVKGHRSYVGVYNLSAYGNKSDAEKHLNDIRTCKLKMFDDSAKDWYGRLEDLGGDYDSYTIEKLYVENEYTCPYGNNKKKETIMTS